MSFQLEKNPDHGIPANTMAASEMASGVEEVGSGGGDGDGKRGTEKIEI